MFCAFRFNLVGRNLFHAKCMPLRYPYLFPTQFGKFFHAHTQDAKQPIAVAVERSGGDISVYHTRIHGTDDMARADAFYLDRLVKFLLWSKGGWRVVLCGAGPVGQTIVDAYAMGGSREFDRVFMEGVYEREFCVELCAYEACPSEQEQPKSMGGFLSGHRIGFDAGGSDRKVSAVIDGETIYSEEVVWFPKENTDPSYHYEGIVSALKTATSKLPRVDAVEIGRAHV